MWRNIKPFVKNWNKFNKEQKEGIVKGFKCMFPPYKKVVERRITKDKNGSSTFTVYEDEEGNQCGEMWGVKFIHSKNDKT